MAYAFLATLVLFRHALPAVARESCEGESCPTHGATHLLQKNRIGAKMVRTEAEGYTPGDPGAPWSDDEIKAIRETLWRFFDGSRGDYENAICELLGDEEYPCILERFNPNVYESCDSPNMTPQSAPTDIKCNGGSKKMSLGAIPSTGKFLRLGFHDCWLYTDGTGGCDGCLNFEGMYVIKNMDERPSVGGKRKADLPYDLLSSANNNLAATADLLEAIYTNVDYGWQRNLLTKSLQETGKSRADLWAYAALLSAEHAMAKNNNWCADPEQLHLYKEPTLNLPHACAVTPSRAFRFYTGRKDCPESSRPPPSERSRDYETLDVEVTANPHASGKEIVQFMEDNFRLSGRDTVAIMGAHTFGNYNSVNDVFRYTWMGRELGQSSTMNNLYYRVMAFRPVYTESDLVAIAELKAKNRPIPGPSATKFIQTARGLCPNSGPIQWFMATEPEAGSGFFSGRTHAGFLNTDVGLYLDFDTLENGFPVGNSTHCTPLGSGQNANDHHFNKAAATQTCLQTAPSGDGKALWEVVEEYADDQDKWWDDFTVAMEKMLSNGYESSELFDNGLLTTTTTTAIAANPRGAACLRSWCCGGYDSKSVCCAASCGGCGGKGCKERPGGASQCCTTDIKDAGRGCSDKYDTVCLKPGSPDITH